MEPANLTTRILHAIINRTPADSNVSCCSWACQISMHLMDISRSITGRKFTLAATSKLNTKMSRFRPKQTQCQASFHSSSATLHPFFTHQKYNHYYYAVIQKRRHCICVLIYSENPLVRTSARSSHSVSTSQLLSNVYTGYQSTK